MKHIIPYTIFEATKSAEPFITLPSRNLKTNYNQIKNCINVVLNAMKLKGADLLLEIAIVETYLGTYKGTVRTSGNGGRGVWQIDKIAFDDIRDTKHHPQLKKYIQLVKNNLDIDILNLKWDDCNNLIVGCIFARLVMVLKNITPNDVSRKERAKQWKQYYNTVAGKGTPEKYWNTVQLCLKTLNIPDKWEGLSYKQADFPVYTNNNQKDIKSYETEADSTMVKKSVKQIQKL